MGFAGPAFPLQKNGSLPGSHHVDALQNIHHFRVIGDKVV